MSGSREPVDADGVLADEKNGDLDTPGSACSKAPGKARVVMGGWG